MTNDGVNTLTYDVENHTLTASGSYGSGSYVYDGNGLRVKKTVSGTTTIYIFSGSKVIAEYASGASPSSPTKEYIYSGGALLATVTSSSTTYQHSDHLSVRMSTNTSGTDIADQGHFPYGETWYMSSGGTKWQFTSYERDAESGNDYAQARYNVSRLGRFSSPDPIPGSIADPQSLNRYSYVRNMPVMAIDPSGMCIAAATNISDDSESKGADASIKYFVSDAELDPPQIVCGSTNAGSGAPGGSVSLDGVDITDYSGGGMGIPIGGGDILGLALLPVKGTAYLEGESWEKDTGWSFFSPGSPDGGDNSGGGGLPLPGGALCSGPVASTSSLCKPPLPPCIKASELGTLGNATLNALSFWAQITGTTYFTGVSASITRAIGLGASGSATAVLAASPQGERAVVVSLALQATVGTSARSLGGVVGSATYQSLSGFLGPSTGGDAQAQLIPWYPVVLGGGASQNSSGTLTYAFIGGGTGGRFSAGPSISGTSAGMIIPICQ